MTLVVAGSLIGTPVWTVQQPSGEPASAARRRAGTSHPVAHMWVQQRKCAVEHALIGNTQDVASVRHGDPGQYLRHPLWLQAEDHGLRNSELSCVRRR